MKQWLIENGELTREQKQALREANNAAYNLRKAFERMSAAWNELEAKNCPIGFMDRNYPFAENFEITKDNAGYWLDDIGNYIDNNF